MAIFKKSLFVGACALLSASSAWSSGFDHSDAPEITPNRWGVARDLGAMALSYIADPLEYAQVTLIGGLHKESHYPDSQTSR